MIISDKMFVASYACVNEQKVIHFIPYLTFMKYSPLIPFKFFQTTSLT